MDPKATRFITWKTVFGLVSLFLTLCLQHCAWFPYSGHIAGFLITEPLKKLNLLTDYSDDKIQQL